MVSGDQFAVKCYGFISELKISVSESETKREERSFSDSIIVAIAYIDTFPVTGIIQVAEVSDIAKIIGSCPGRGQFSGRIHSSEEDRSQHVSCVNAELGEEEDIPYIMERRKINRPSCIKDEHKVFITALKCLDVPYFSVCKKEISFYRFTVGSFAADS